MDALVNPHDLGGACNGMGGRPSVQLESAASLVYDLALGHRRCRTLTSRPSVLAVDGTCNHDRRLERLGKQGHRRHGAGHEWIGTPREFEGVGDSISVGIGEIWRSSVDSPLHFVGKSIPVRVPRRIRREVDAAAGERKRVVAKGDAQRTSGVASKVRPGRGLGQVCLEVEREDIGGKSPRKHGKIGEATFRIDIHRPYARRAAARGDAGGATEQEERQRLVARAEKEHRVAGKGRHRRRVSRRRVKPGGSGPEGVRHLAGRVVTAEKLIRELASIAYKQAGEISGWPRFIHGDKRHDSLCEPVRPVINPHEANSVIGTDEMLRARRNSRTEKECGCPDCIHRTVYMASLHTAQSIPQFKAKRSPENADFPRSIRKRILQGRFSCKRILHVYLRNAVFCYTLATRKETADGKEIIENEKINPDCISRNVHLNTMRGKRIRMATAPRGNPAGLRGFDKCHDPRQHVASRRVRPAY